jgi:hypothetical protein
MVLVNILSEPPVNQNTSAFLSPIIWNKNRFLSYGLKFKVFNKITPNISDCDVLAVNSKFWSASNQDHLQKIIEWLSQQKETICRVVYFDRSSTAGHVTPEILPIVDSYYKTSLFKDRSLYQKPLYGSRLFCNYYHHKLGIKDEIPTYSRVISDQNNLDKLAISWNTGLANYSLTGPRLAKLYGNFPIRSLLRPVQRYHAPRISRSIDVNCRMSLNYKYETLGYQRKETARLLKKYRKVDRVAKAIFLKELRNSKIVASPFGSSEINYRDFETFICGALLLKPDMSHIETYPNFYEDNKTFVAHRWDLDDLEEKVDDILTHWDRYLHIANTGQELYRSHVSTVQGHEIFCQRFVNLITGLHKHKIV